MKLSPSDIQALPGFARALAVASGPCPWWSFRFVCWDNDFKNCFASPFGHVPEHNQIPLAQVHDGGRVEFLGVERRAGE